jgi:membrane-bound metal-dependent hydrolase YbcI (DUF457 family)
VLHPYQGWGVPDLKIGHYMATSTGGWRIELDFITHALTSLALARGFFPRRGWAVAAGMVVAGTLAEADVVSALFGPSAYLSWHGTSTHSLVGTLVIVAIATMVTRRLDAKKAQPVMGIVVATALAAVAHLLLDLCQSEGVSLLWPVRGTRFAADLLPSVDAWILALLILGLVTPELFRLVSSEIGAKDKTPRGRNGAIVALALILVYVGARFALHASAVAELDAHSYRGESPRKVGAFADALSVFAWHGIVETQSLVCELDAPVGPGSPFNAEAATCQHKPEPSQELELAQQTAAARKFVSVARFPKASVEKTQNGYEVVIWALEDRAEQISWHGVAAQIELDGQPQVVKEELVWGADLGRH